MYDDLNLSEMDVEKELGGYPLAIIKVTYIDRSANHKYSFE